MGSARGDAADRAEAGCCRGWSRSSATGRGRPARGGLQVRTGVDVTSVAGRMPDGPVDAALGDDTTIEADEVLFATGAPRAPTTSAWRGRPARRAAGWTSTTPARARRTTADWLYAVGDVNHRALLTHQGKYQARITGDAIAARADRAAVRHDAVGHACRDRRSRGRPAGDVHRPGSRLRRPHRADEAEKAGYRVRAVDYDSAASRARTLSPTATSAGPHGRRRGPRVPARRDLRRAGCRGAAALGNGRGGREVPIDRLWHAVPCFPTISEIWLRLLETYRG